MTPPAIGASRAVRSALPWDAPHPSTQGTQGMNGDATPDGRALHVRVKALAHRFDAMAIGAEKQAAISAQIAQNHRRDAATLHDAATALSALHQSQGK